MESPTPSHGIIPAKKLKIWNVFSDMGNGDVLKVAKLAHAHGTDGYIVTMRDQTYHFDRHECWAGMCLISELCDIRVKGECRKK